MIDLDMNKNKVFSQKIPSPRNIWHKLFGGKNKEMALAEIYNLLSRCEIFEVKYQDIYHIASKHNVKLHKDLPIEIAKIYREYLQYCLEDSYLSDKEIEELQHLKKILSLTDQEVGKAHSEIAGEVYKMEVEKAVEDGRLQDDEKQFLQKLQNDLRLNSTIANKIYQHSASEMLKKFMDEALSDHRLTDEEEDELIEIKKSLNIEVHLDGATRANFEKYKLFWQIENGEYPEFEIDEPLQENEKCYFYTNAEWLCQNVNLANWKKKKTGLELKCTKGYFFATEQKELKPVIEDIWATMDNGRVYLTNKRIILLGNENSVKLPLHQIVDFSTYKNGVDIVHMDKNVFLQFQDHLDIFSMLLSKALLET